MATTRKGSKASRKTPARRTSTTKSTKSSAGARKADALSALPDFVVKQLHSPATSRRFRNATPIDERELQKRGDDAGIELGDDRDAMLDAVNRIKPESPMPFDRMPTDVQGTLKALQARRQGFHGGKMSLAYFPTKAVTAPCADRFGYLTPPRVRAASRLPFNPVTLDLIDQLGDLMGDPNREPQTSSTIPAGFTYVGQFIDHDVTLDVSSSLDTAMDANAIPNMRTPALDLDSLYGRGPALDPFLYDFPTAGPPTAIRMQLGSNTNTGPGGPAGTIGNRGGMKVQTSFDVPRIHNPLNPAASSMTAVIGDPRNDENLIVSQFHHAMLRFHNRVVDMLVLAGFTGDIFVEAKRIVTQHYQWAVVNDFLKRRVCDPAAVAHALATVVAAIGSPFRMPVEFAVAAYRFGHSMIRDNYWVNFNFTSATLGEVFTFIRKPNLPVLSNWVVDFNAFFDTGVPVPVNNKARQIDSVLANGLESLPGFTGLAAVLAKRNLRRGVALGLPSGQAVAKLFGIPAMTSAQLLLGLPANEVAVLQASNGLLLKKTPLWYYVLREAAVLGSGNRLGPVGARIVAMTFVRMLKRDANSYLNVSGGFVPMLPSATPGDFTFADLVTFAGVTQP